MNRLLIQVVPRLTPSRCGVTDHAISLARELESAFGINTAFAVLNSSIRCDLPYPVIHCAPSHLLDACLSLSEGRPGALLVHLSGYGYSEDGAPTLLAEALAHVKASDRFRVAVYFHELFATGAPWRSAFWHSRRQRRAVQKIAEECDLMLTSTRRHADWLERALKGRFAAPVQLLPVFSTIGETCARTPAARRERVMAVFGLPGTRQSSYSGLRPLGKTLRDLGIKEIIDIGPELDVPKELSGIPVKQLGMLPAADLAERLSRATYGFVSRRPDALAKSGVFAGYCAHGTIPLLAESFSAEVDGLKDGVHLFSPQTARSPQPSELERCSMAAWTWYTGHNLHVHASRYHDWLMHEGGAGPTLVSDEA